MNTEIVEIKPQKGWVPLNLVEIWRFRELMYFLVWRDVKVKYKQTLFGVLWVLLQPLISMLIYTALFAYLARMDSEGLPYPLFVLPGLLLWSYFSAIVGQSAGGLMGGAHLISKVYFPRLIMPLSSIFPPLLDFFISSLILGLVLAYYGIVPGSGVLLIPLLLVITMINAVGVGIWLSALNVRYRDVQFVVPFLLQLWMYASPIFYPRGLVGEKYAWLFLLNPLTGVVEAFRLGIIGHASAPWIPLGVSAVIGIAVLLSGMFYFRRVERLVVDII